VIDRVHMIAQMEVAVPMVVRQDLHMMIAIEHLCVVFGNCVFRAAAAPLWDLSSHQQHRLISSSLKAICCLQWGEGAAVSWNSFQCSLLCDNVTETSMLPKWDQLPLLQLTLLDGAACPQHVKFLVYLMTFHGVLGFCRLMWYFESHESTSFNSYQVCSGSLWAASFSCVCWTMPVVCWGLCFWRGR
jgi:hypothetical protein